ncbi:Endoglucanase [Mizuhopecten yessoensis]|uniref:cellulase n=1 Tax=Mizuhopecten yessoensis TaxID=6573 RepID=A0A210PV35_MIZYE|nr:Endoglucanase [Mizuhopecten yessoensis]
MERQIMPTGDSQKTMAAASIAFKTKGSVRLRMQHIPFSSTVLNKDKPLYTFAKTYRESGYNDVWLYKATQETTNLADAREFYSALSGTPWALSWDSNAPAVQVLLYGITNEQAYRSDIVNLFKSWELGNDLHYTPQGLAWQNRWEALRYTGQSSASFLYYPCGTDGGRDKYRTWAE